jgi:2-polyprenyl-3-methyl-5-hydroxy-6-metoxy-1,4-benzoquinol methylase
MFPVHLSRLGEGQLPPLSLHRPSRPTPCRVRRVEASSPQIAKLVKLDQHPSAAEGWGALVSSGGGRSQTPAHGADDENSLVGPRAFAQLGEATHEVARGWRTPQTKLETVMIDEGRLNQLIGQMVSDLGGASSVAMVRIGDALGLYKALHANGAMTAAELGSAVGAHERYVREWLSNQAASNYLTYEPTTRKFSLSGEQAMVFAVDDSPVYMLGGFDLMAAMLANQPKVEKAFRTGGGVAWGEQAGCMFCAVARFFRPGYHNNLIGSWLPALDGVVDKLTRGAQVADVGCGHGWSTVMMAKAFPNSHFVGYDFHLGSIEAARAHADSQGVFENVRFEVGTAKDYSGTGLDLVTFFDCLHDMGDPAGAAAHVRRSLKPDGSWMIVEPMAGDTLEQNLNPVSRLFYAASTMICVPTSLSQEVGSALGAQAGEARLREVITAGGFTKMRRATETPFNMILEACP